MSFSAESGSQAPRFDTPSETSASASHAVAPFVDILTFFRRRTTSQAVACTEHGLSESKSLPVDCPYKGKARVGEVEECPTFMSCTIVTQAIEKTIIDTMQASVTSEGDTSDVHFPETPQQESERINRWLKTNYDTISDRLMPDQKDHDIILDKAEE